MLPRQAIVFTTTATSPCGHRRAGYSVLADRYGRRIPLMANVIYFSLIELMCGFSQTTPCLSFCEPCSASAWVGSGRRRVARNGGSGPLRWRGILRRDFASAIDRISAGGGGRKVSPAPVGMAPDVLDWCHCPRCSRCISVRKCRVGAWKQHRAASSRTGLRIFFFAGEWKRFAYLVVLMTFMMFLSHGTQDLYPDFLKEVAQDFCPG